MSPYHMFQLCIFGLSVNLFSLFTYLVFVYDQFSSKIFSDLRLQYDYIIVGSGTAGSLIAHRIATETNYTFIVLEAGSRGHAFHEIPIFGPLLHGSPFDWQYETVPQKNACFAMDGFKSKQIQGKILGGSSKLNNMIYVRGNITHYHKWFHGKYTKDYIQAQFESLEENVLQLNNIKYETPLSDVLIRAAKELKYEELHKDFDLGFKKTTVMQNKGKRWTISDTLDYKNIRTNTMVTKLIIENNKCIGVEINTPNGFSKVFARKGVIVSAGTYNSAKILQLSGIGPTEVLKPLNISVVKELPVGKNLQDHIGTGLDLMLFDMPQTFQMWEVLNPFNVFHYFYNGRGPFTTPGCEVIGFVSTKNEVTPDLQYMVLPTGISFDRGVKLRKSVGITDGVWEKYFTKSFDKYTTTVLPIILHPKSKGEVRIQSTDPNVPPLIDPKYLSHKDDIEILKSGLKIVKTIIETESMKGINAQINNVHFPGCENYDFFSDSYLECYIRHLTLSIYHPVGTCSMGLSESKSSVVDTSFQVIGIYNLYVVDGSVLPTLPSGNINAAIAMMANIFFENNISLRKTPKNMLCDNLSFKELVLNICSVR